MIIQTLYLFPWDPQSSKTILRIHQFQIVRTQKLLRTYQVSPLTFFGRVWKLSTTFSFKKVLSEMEKNDKAISYSRPRMEVESTIEYARSTSNAGSKIYVWPLVRTIHGILSETQMVSVEAVGVMPSVTGCHTLAHPFARRNTISPTKEHLAILSPLVEMEKKREEKKTDSTKILFKIFHD